MELDEYINIIIDTISELKLTIPDDIICNFKRNKHNLKFNILALEQYIFSNSIVSNTITSHWKFNRFIWDYEFIKVDKDDYDRIFKFFLIILHNIPYFQPHCDHIIPGCNILYKKIANYNKYYEDKLKYNSPLYMRLVDWNKNTVSTNFNCYCENFQLS